METHGLDTDGENHGQWVQSPRIPIVPENSHRLSISIRNDSNLMSLSIRGFDESGEASYYVPIAVPTDETGFRRIDQSFDPTSGIHSLQLRARLFSENAVAHVDDIVIEDSDRSVAVYRNGFEVPTPSPWSPRRTEGSSGPSGPTGRSTRRASSSGIHRARFP